MTQNKQRNTENELMINMTPPKHHVQPQGQDNKSDGFNSSHLSGVKPSHPGETDTYQYQNMDIDSLH